MLRPSHRRVTVAALLVTLAGCSSIMQGILFGISKRSVSRQVRVAVPNTQAALNALAAANGASSIGLSTAVPDGFLRFAKERPAFAALQPAAQAGEEDRIMGAVAVLRDPTVVGLVNTSNQVLGGRAAGQPLRLPTDRAGWTNLHRKLEDAALMDSWSALADSSRAYANHLRDTNGLQAARVEAGRLAKTAYYVREYIRAYFSGMQLFRIKVDLSQFTERMEESIRKRLKKLDPEMDETELIEKAKEILAKELKAAIRKLLKKDDLPKIDEIVEKLLAGQPVDVFGWGLGTDPDAPVGFTSRAGDNFQWPTVEVAIDASADNVVSWSDIDAKAIGSQLIRVFIEAVFDAQLGVPGVGSATGVQLKREEYRLQEFVAAEDGALGVTTEEFNAINDWGGRAEGVASSAIGQLIRGIGWISLNNEALAGLIETAVGVMVRKLVEAALWERYFDDQPESANAAFAAARMGHVTVDFQFTDISRPPDK